MILSLRPVRLATGNSDETGCRVFADDRLVAVLVQLSEAHDSMAGHWFLEAGFNRRLEEPVEPTFADLDAAQGWIARRLGPG
ncbi:MAG TPA: hypothetical protein VHJ78_13765 [Actinomycetota bacterium]|nr:hypothetical protein [Actinomycetota bacterium]